MDDSFDELNITCALSPDSLSDLINYNDKNKLKENILNYEWKMKFYELEKIKGDLLVLSTNPISLDNFKILKRMAETKGGFLTNDLRRTFWKKILSVEMTKEKNLYEFVFISKESNELVTVQEPLDIKIENDYSNIILADVRRSKVNRIFNKAGGYNDTNITLRKSLKKFINTMVTINNKEYHYFQSYHDIGLYFLMLYIKNFETGIMIFQRFSEFFLKQNLIQNERDTERKGFDFVKINDIVIEIIKNLSKEVFDFLDVRVDFVFPWVVALFTHNIMESSIIYRLFDFFITSHPLSVYYLTAVILIDEILKIKSMNLKGWENEDFFEHFQEINMEKIDYDHFILETVNAMNDTFPVKNLIALLKENFEFDESLPIMKEESYAEILIDKIEKQKNSVNLLNKWWIIGPTLSVALLAIFFKKKLSD